jgi:hypothetical protein
MRQGTATGAAGSVPEALTSFGNVEQTAEKLMFIGLMSKSGREKTPPA